KGKIFGPAPPGRAEHLGSACKKCCWRGVCDKGQFCQSASASGGTGRMPRGRPGRRRKRTRFPPPGMRAVLCRANLSIRKRGSTAPPGKPAYRGVAEGGIISRGLSEPGG